MRDRMPDIEGVELDQRSAQTLLEAVRLGLRQDRRLGESAYRQIVVRLQLGDRRGLGPVITPLLDEDRRLREYADLMAGRELDGPTVELLQKRRGLVLLRMRQRGTLEEHHLRAAGEIRAASEAGLRTPNVSSAYPVQERVDASLNPSRLSPSLALDERVERCFKRWLEELDQTFAHAILAIIVDDKPLHIAESELSIGKGRMAKVVRDALERYCDMAGWGIAKSVVDALGG